MSGYVFDQRSHREHASNYGGRSSFDSSRLSIGRRHDDKYYYYRYIVALERSKRQRIVEDSGAISRTTYKAAHKSARRVGQISGQKRQRRVMNIVLYNLIASINKVYNIVYGHRRVHEIKLINEALLRHQADVILCIMRLSEIQRFELILDAQQFINPDYKPERYPGLLTEVKFKSRYTNG